MAGTVIVEIKHMAFPRVSIPKDTYVVWRNADPVPHSAETTPNASYYFIGGALHPGELSSPVHFARPGSYPYLCRFHAGMTGTIEVTEDGPVAIEPDPAHHSHPGDHRHHHGGGHGPGEVRHLHGFAAILCKCVRSAPEPRFTGQQADNQIG